MLSLAFAGAAGAEPLPPCPQGGSAREQQCLRGPVWSVSTHVVAIGVRGGELNEGARRPSALDPAMVFTPAGYLAEQTDHGQTGELKEQRMYAYDRAGRLQEVFAFGPDGAMRGGSKFAYDARGRRTQEQRYGADGAPSATVSLTYDVLNRLVEETVTNPNGGRVLQWAYAYNEQGYRIREAVSTASRARTRDPASKLYTYANGPLPSGERFFNVAGTLLVRVAYGYDLRGNIIEARRYDGNDFPLGVTLYEYEYDAQGNWIKRRRLHEYSDNKARPVEIAYRTISYFDDAAASTTTP